MQRSRLPVSVEMQSHAAEAAAMLKELANPSRLLILCQLIDGEKSVGELRRAIDLSQSAVSQHLARLREARLVDTEKRGQMVYYRLCNMEAHALLSTLYLIYCKR
jgi:ArsR family transcriptional regulator, virulence genes transcriptional regulator